jgi:hypothetical protein
MQSCGPVESICKCVSAWNKLFLDEVPVVRGGISYVAAGQRRLSTAFPTAGGFISDVKYH